MSNKPEMGSRVPFSREIWIDRARTSVKKRTNEYKRLVLNKEVRRLRNAFVVKAERAEKTAKAISPLTLLPMIRKPLNKGPADGRTKSEGVIHWSA